MSQIKHIISKPVRLAHGMQNIVETELLVTSKASWERYDNNGDQFQVLWAQKHLDAGWVQIKLREQGSKSSRETHITLDANQAAELAKLLSTKAVQS